MVASHVWGRDVERCGGIAARANVRHPGEGGEGEERREDSGTAPLKVLGWILVVPPRVRAKRGFLVLEDGGQRARGRPVGRRYAVRAHSVMRGSPHVPCAASPTHRVASPTDRYRTMYTCRLKSSGEWCWRGGKFTRAARQRLPRAFYWNQSPIWIYSPDLRRRGRQDHRPCRPISRSSPRPSTRRR